MNTTTHRPLPAPIRRRRRRRCTASSPALHWLQIAHAERRRRARARDELARARRACAARPRPARAASSTRTSPRRAAPVATTRVRSGVRRPIGYGRDEGTATWRLTAAATALTALIAGSRASFGMFLSPLNTATGLGMASIAWPPRSGSSPPALALPFVEALARRFGTGARHRRRRLPARRQHRAARAWSTRLLALVFLMLVVFAAGTAVASNALLIGEVSRRARGRRARPGERRRRRRRARRAAAARAARHRRDRDAGLGRGALRARRASPARAAAGALVRAAPGAATAARPPARAGGDGAARPPLLADRRRASRICGFHVAFLTVHMPGVIERCGLSTAFTGALAGRSPAPPTWPAASASAC